MPCRDYSENDRVRYEMSPEDRARLDHYAKMLCVTCQYLEDKGLSMPTIVVSKWWEAHKAADGRARQIEAERKRRLRDEMAVKVSAWKKLTPKERTLLGVKNPKAVKDDTDLDI